MHYTMNYAYDFKATQLVHRPARSSNANVKPPKPKTAPQRRALDPEDLTRRLQIVIAERNATDERRRRSRTVATATSSKSSRPPERKPTTVASLSDKHNKSKAPEQQRTENSLAARFRRRSSKCATADEQGSAATTDNMAPSGPPYVPQVAAAQFARTTLGESPPPPDKSHHIHKLSRSALKYHLGGVNADAQVAATAAAGIAPIEQARALRRAQSQREKNYDRNQFQSPAASSMPNELDAAAAAATAPELGKRYTAEQSEEERHLRASRRRSTGSFLSHDPSSIPPPLQGADLAAIIEAHRVDWSQSDEVPDRCCAASSPPHRPKSASPPQSPKGESKWKFRGRLNSLHRHKEEKSPSPPTTDSAELPKSPMASLFARFKR